MPTRRQVLATVAGAGGAATVGTIPAAVEAATLAADVDVAEAYRNVRTGDVDLLFVDVTSRRGPDREPIEPAVTVWGAGRQTQIPWRLLAPVEPIPPGETRRLRALAPGDRQDVQLHPDKRAQVTCYDRGTERRSHDTFVPNSV